MLPDDITFLKPDASNPQKDVFAGLPAPPLTVSPGVGQVQREGRYSWAYMLERPASADPSSVNLTVVVYSQRPLQSSGTLQPTDEIPYRWTGTSGAPIRGAQRETVLTLAYDPSATKPPIRRGTWILDATLERINVGPGLSFGWSHGEFYRVVGYTETTDTSTSNTFPAYELELDRPLKGSIDLQQTQLLTRIPQIIVMDNVVEVFPKGTGWPSPP
jgi:hypothetical protein